MPMCQCANVFLSASACTEMQSPCLCSLDINILIVLKVVTYLSGVNQKVKRVPDIKR